MVKIASLTPEQEALIPEYLDRYMDIACGGHRIDRAKLQKAFNDAYTEVNLEAPILLTFNSPLACMMAIRALEKNYIPGKLEDMPERYDGNNWALFLKDNPDIYKKLGNEKLWKSEFLYGSQDLYWIAWGRFVETEIKVNLTSEISTCLDIMERISSQCEWWWPFEGVVIASERPSVVHWDDQKRLHCETGPAFTYSDGYGVYSWHGTQIPKEWIETKPSAKVAITWKNIEQRRAACEIVGWAKIIDELGGKKIDVDPNPEIGTLMEVNIPDIGKEKFLYVRCGTWNESRSDERHFALPVPPNMKTARQANAWTYGLTNPEDYELEVRT